MSARVTVGSVTRYRAPPAFLARYIAAPLAALTGDSDADAGRQRHVPAVGCPDGADRTFGHPGGDPLGLAGVVQVITQHHELVTTESSQRVPWAKRGAQPVDDFREHTVARLVAEDGRQPRLPSAR